MSMSANALTTLSNFKAYTVIGAATTWDTMLELIINSVSLQINRFTRRMLAKTTYTGLYLDGNGKQTLWLPNAPVIGTLSSLKENAVALTEGPTGSYYLYADRGTIFRPAPGLWPASPKILQVTYTAGYIVQGGAVATGETALPADIEMACLMQTAYEWKRAKDSNWGETSRSHSDGTISRVESGLLDAVEQLLRHHVRFMP